MGLFPGAFNKELGLESLAHQATLHIGDDGNNSIDLPGSYLFLERLKREITWHSLVSKYCEKKRRELELTPEYRSWHLSIIVRHSQAGLAWLPVRECKFEKAVGACQRLVLIGAEDVAESLDERIVELFLALVGLAFQLRAQGLAPALDSIAVFCTVGANGAAGHLGVSYRQAGVGIFHFIDSIVGGIVFHRFSYIKLQ